MKFAVLAVLSCMCLNSAVNGFFLKSRSRNPHSQYGPPKPNYGPPPQAKPSYSPPKPSYKPPEKHVEIESNEIDDGYGSPAAPVVSSQPEPTYQQPAKTYKEPSKPMYHPPMMRPSYHPPPKMPMYKMRPPMYRMPMYRKIKKKPRYMMFKMPRYKLPKMRLPKFMMMMPKFPKFPRMPMYRLKPSRPMYGKPAQHNKPVQENNHGGYKHMDNLDYSGWTPIGMTHSEPEEPSYNAINESPILTIEDAYNSPSSKPIPPLPSGDGYDAPELITAAPAEADSYGVPQADPVSYEAPSPAYKEPEKDTYGTPEAPIISYKEPEPLPDTYGQPAAEPISNVQVTYTQPIAPAPAYKEPEPAYKEPEKDTYGTPLAPLVSYKEPEKNEYEAPQAPPAPATSTPPIYHVSTYNPPAPLYSASPAYTQSTVSPIYHQPAYGGYSSPIEEPLFEYAPVSDLNNLAAAAIEDTYHSAAAPPLPGRYQATADASALAQEVQSGSVYVQPNANVYNYHQQPQQNAISYPSYGEKIPTSNQYGSTEPLYYQSPSYSQTNYASPASTYQGTGGKSSASFSIHVNGKEHGHSYSHDHKV